MQPRMVNDHRTNLHLIKRCKSILQLHQIHAHAVTSGGLVYLHSSSTLIKIIDSIAFLVPAVTADPRLSASFRRYSDSVFDNVHDPPPFCWNVIIRIHTLLLSPLRALHRFVQMRRASVAPDFHTLPIVLKASAQLLVFSLVESLHSLAVKFGFISDLFASNCLIHVYFRLGHVPHAHQLFDESFEKDVISHNTLIHGYARAGEMEKARELFDDMPVRDSVSWGTLMAGYARGNYYREAIQLFDLMMDSGCVPDDVALVSVLSACAHVGELERGKEVHYYIRKNRIGTGSFLSTALIDLYAKCGCIEAARNVFESSRERSLFTWNSMLLGLAKHGLSHLVLHYFARMIEAGMQPDRITYLGVLVGCSHGGLLDKARTHFNEMESLFGVTREAMHYACMVDLLGRAGMIEEAVEMIKKMPVPGDISAWSCLLGGCRTHGNIEIAERAARRVMELKPEDGGVYSILANVYAVAERWEDVVKTRRSLSCNRTVKKITAFSSIQLNGVVHEFIAGERLHSRIDEIYFVLNGMNHHQS